MKVEEHGRNTYETKEKLLTWNHNADNEYRMSAFHPKGQIYS